VDRSSKATKRRVASQVRDKIKEEIERGEFAKPGEHTFLSAAVAYMNAGGEKRYIPLLLERFKERTLRSITQEDVDRAAIELYPDASPATRNRQVYTPVSAVMKQGGLRDKLGRPKNADGQRIVAWLWPEQAFRLFKEADKIDAEFGLLLRLLCYTGLRLSEALRLEVDMVRLSESFAYIVRTKNDDPRPVFLPPVVVAALANHPRGMNRSDQRVFRFSKSGALYASLRAAAKAAKVRFPSRSAFHLFRHTWASWMRRYSGLDTKGLVATQAWKDEKSASRYSHAIASEEAMRAVNLPTETSGESVENRGKRRKAV
jgi:integrase